MTFSFYCFTTTTWKSKILFKKLFNFSKNSKYRHRIPCTAGSSANSPPTFTLPTFPTFPVILAKSS